jgi:hypothetical protein
VVQMTSCCTAFFRFLRRLQNFFQSGCTSLHSHQQCKRVPFSPASLPIPVVSGVVNDGYSNRVRWNLSVVLICIFFIARDGEHFFMCFWPFEFLLLRKFCLVHLPISLLVH